MERALIFGASRGLGAALTKVACEARYPVIGWGRKEARLRELREAHPLFEYRVADFSSLHGQDEVLRALEADQPFSKVFLVAGGGPFGAYQERDWSAHEWAWQVTFQFPARVVHKLMALKRREQVILIGSAVAESAGDPLAASYASAKHALKGLYSSLHSEDPDWDLRLFSPGYMDTELLPRHASVRALGVYSPLQIARELWTWSLTADIGGHKVYPKHPI